MLQANWVTFNVLRNLIINLEYDSLLLFVSLHFIQVDYLLEKFARIDALFSNLELPFLNGANVLQVKDVELDHLIAALNSI